MDDGIPEQIGEHFKHITDDIRRYIKKRFELLLIDIGEEYARWIAESLLKIAGLIFLFGALVFLLIALALYLGAVLHSRSLGFVIVSVPFLIIGYLFFKLKPKSITRKLKKELEQEMIAIFDIEFERERKRLISSDSRESKNKKGKDV